MPRAKFPLQCRHLWSCGAAAAEEELEEAEAAVPEEAKALGPKPKDIGAPTEVVAAANKASPVPEATVLPVPVEGAEEEDAAPSPGVEEAAGEVAVPEAPTVCAGGARLRGGPEGNTFEELAEEAAAPGGCGGPPLQGGPKGNAGRLLACCVWLASFPPSAGGFATPPLTHGQSFTS